MPTHDEYRESLVREVMERAPTDLTPQERLAALAFAADVLVFEPGHPMDRVIRTPLDDVMFQRRISVSSARKVRDLARALAAKGLLEAVELDGGTRYRFARLSGPEHDKGGQTDGH
ncbi:MAG TPA: hypothetical protein VL551_28105 [Actinospica sp.]|jgi:hypothetical protein|nr:hypothetical protein [Actinospica sp.]